MNIYEHGLAADTDQWAGRFALLASTGLPVYAGFTLTIVDPASKSLNERAVGLCQVNGPHPAAEFYEEADLRYCVLATLYHLNRLIDLYVHLAQRFDELHPSGTATEGNTSDPRVYYELDAFLGAARRVYESIRKVLWKHCAPARGGRWSSIRGALSSEGIIPAAFHKRLTESWHSFGERLKDYRDCVTHYDPLINVSTTCSMQRYGEKWGMSIKLPANPEKNSRRSFDFASGPEALTYCHSVACHLVALCEDLGGVEAVRHRLENPRLGVPASRRKAGRDGQTRSESADTATK